MKLFLVGLLLLYLPPICFAQHSISSHMDTASLSHYNNLVMGYWIDTEDSNETMLITKDSLFEYQKINNKKVEDMHLLKKIRYAYNLSYKDSNAAAPAGNPELKTWRGYYLQAWDDSHKMEKFWTEAVYSVTETHLYLGEKGEYVFKRKNK